jgi:hypothetical protein
MTLTQTEVQDKITKFFTGILGAEDLSVSVTPPVGAPINPAFAVSVTCGVPETQLSHPVTIEVPNGATITFTV